MGVPGEVGSITLTIPPYLVVVVASGVGDAGLLALGVVLTVVTGGAVEVGTVATGVAAVGWVAAGVVEVGVLVLQPERIKTIDNKISQGINNLFIPSSFR
jgi:pheromone shutdown protein TraB